MNASRATAKVRLFTDMSVLKIVMPTCPQRTNTGEVKALFIKLYPASGYRICRLSIRIISMEQYKKALLLTLGVDGAVRALRRGVRAPDARCWDAPLVIARIS